MHSKQIKISSHCAKQNRPPYNVRFIQSPVVFTAFIVKIYCADPIGKYIENLVSDSPSTPFSWCRVTVPLPSLILYHGFTNISGFTRPKSHSPPDASLQDQEPAGHTTVPRLHHHYNLRQQRQRGERTPQILQEGMGQPPIRRKELKLPGGLSPGGYTGPLQARSWDY